MTVLIIESSVLISGRIKNLLVEKSQEMAIYQSIGYKKAVLLLDEIDPDVVLLDMYMPGNSSINLLKNIKENKANSIIMALVNREDHDKQLKCRSVGADLILDKYHEFEEIPGLIDSKANERNHNPGNEKPKHYSEFA
jgi:DNA-binding NarL/FixJ family response regulator